MDPAAPSPHPAGWSRPAVDAGALWAASGAQWLTAADVAVPVGLVGEIVGLVDHLDERIDDPAARLTTSSTAGGVGLLAERAALVGFGPSGRTSCGGGTRLVCAKDGRLAVSLARDDDVDLVPAWLGIGHVPPGSHWEVVESAVVDRSASDLVDRAIELGLPCTRVGEATAPSAPGGGVSVSWRGAGRPRRLGSLLVVNLASLWAGPLAADVLARLGARVVTVESQERPDGSRATLGFFESLHGRTESVSLPFRTETGRRRLRDLVSAADVVIEGSRPRALAQLGIDVEEHVRDGERIWVSITAHGRHGAAGERVGFGDDAAAAGGLVGWIDGEPTFLADAVADPLAGLTSAAAVVDLVEAGVGGIVDVALSRVAASCVDHPLAGTSERRSNVERPRARSDRGGPLPLGRDTERVLAELGID